MVKVLFQKTQSSIVLKGEKNIKGKDSWEKATMFADKKKAEGFNKISLLRINSAQKQCIRHHQYVVNRQHNNQRR